MENQYPETVLALRSEIEQAKAHLAAGGPPSEIANRLHVQGLGVIQLMVVFREATGASIGDLKAFGQWWGRHGVIDEAAFNTWGAEVLARSKA
jgi:hypothetical protein